MDRLKSKVAIITGAARGQGAAEARLFVHEGARVVIADVLGGDVAALAEELNREAGALVALGAAMDVALDADWREICERTLSSFGGVDILVNNAAILTESNLEQTTEAEWDQVLGVNQKGVWLGMRATVPLMRRRGGGSIVNISSIGGLVGTPGYAAYHAAKGAVRMLTKHAAVAYAAENIRCNAVYPGAIRTPMLGDLDAEQYEVTIASTPMRRIGLPEEVARAVLFLASDEASFITGADLSVDGGYTAA